MTSIPHTDPPVDSRALFGQVANLVRTIPSALITTVDSTGIMHTRMLPNTNVDYDGELHFIAPADLPMMREVRRRPEVLVTFSAPGTDQFIVVKGTARTERNSGWVQALWHPSIASWFPVQHNDPTLSVMHVSVGAVEVWD